MYFINVWDLNAGVFLRQVWPGNVLNKLRHVKCEI